MPTFSSENKDKRTLFATDWDRCVKAKDVAYLGNVHGRALTKGEIKLAQSVFGDSIDYDSVRLRMESEQFPLTVQTYGDRSVAFYGQNRHSEDFSLEGESKRANYLHEMTHVYQIQTDPDRKICATSDYAYEDHLKQAKNWLDLSVEHQATVVEKYVHIFLGDKKPSGHDYEDNLKMLSIVEAQFPSAHDARMKKWEGAYSPLVPISEP